MCEREKGRKQHVNSSSSFCSDWMNSVNEIKMWVSGFSKHPEQVAVGKLIVRVQICKSDQVND